MLKRLPGALALYRERLQWRHDLLLTYNPLGVHMQRTRLQLGLPSHLRLSSFGLRNQYDSSALFEYVERENNVWQDAERLADFRRLSKFKSCWSTEAWCGFYPNGIPPLSGDHFETRKLKRLVWNVKMETRIPPSFRHDDHRYVISYIRADANLIKFSADRGEKTRLALQKSGCSSDGSSLVVELQSIQRRPTMAASVRKFLKGISCFV